MRKIVFVALCAIAVLGCKKESVQSLDGVAVTGEALDVTSMTVTLVSRFNIPDSMTPEKRGVLVSTSPDVNANNYERGFFMKDDVVDNEYRVDIPDLEPEKTYYYRAYVRFKYTKQSVCGDVKSFTTPAFENPVTTGSPFVGSACAILNGSVSDYLKNRFYSQPWFECGKAYPERSEAVRITHINLEEDGTFSGDYEHLEKGATYYFRAGCTYAGRDYFGEEKTFQVADFVPTEGDLIDMGLSVKWGSCNVGASDPGKDGDYFAWGETQTKETFLPDNYLYNETPAQLPLTADAASVNLGGSWRMPTKEEYEEIINGANTLHETGVYNGRYGHMYISRKNGNRVFFPCSGWKNEEGVGPVGTSGEYWTSTFSTSTDNYNVAYLWTVGSGSTYFFGPVYYGLTVRGVQE